MNVSEKMDVHKTSHMEPTPFNPYPVSVWRHRALFDFSTFWQKCKNHSFHRGFWHVKPHVSLGFWSHFSNAYVFLGFLHFWYFLQKPIQNQWFCHFKKVKNDRLQNSLSIFCKCAQNGCEQTLCFPWVSGRWDDLWPTTFPLLHTCTTFWAAQKMKVRHLTETIKNQGKSTGTHRQTDGQRSIHGQAAPYPACVLHGLQPPTTSIVQPFRGHTAIPPSLQQSHCVIF